MPSAGAERAGGVHPDRGGGDGGEGPVGPGKAKQDGAVSRNVHSSTPNCCHASLFGQWQETSPKSHLKWSN